MRRITLCGLALALWLGPAAARADQIRWGYDWTAFPGEVPAGQSRVGFSDEPFRTSQGNTDIVAANISTVSTADAAKPDVFGAKAGFYALVLGLQDLASGQWGAVLFQGQVQGRLWQGGSELTNRAVGPSSQKLVLGQTEFTVTLDYSSPIVNGGSIGAHVEVASVPPPPGQVPEPSSLVLAGLGLSAVVLAARRRRASGA